VGVQVPPSTPVVVVFCDFVLLGRIVTTSLIIRYPKNEENAFILLGVVVAFVGFSSSRTR